MNSFSFLCKTLLLFFCFFVIPHGLTGTALSSPVKKDSKEHFFSCVVSIQPEAHATIYNKVALLPFSGSHHNISEQMSQMFFSALLKSKKYTLIPLDTSTRWFYEHVSGKKISTVKAGTDLKSRGIVNGEISFHGSRVNMTNPKRSLDFSAQMIDGKTGDKVWNIKATLQIPAESNQPDLHFIQQAANLGVTRLIAKLVQSGDTFTTRLPQPRIASLSGNKQSVTLFIRPDPVQLFDRYQLLRAKNPNTVFTPVASIKNDPGSALIIEDNNLEKKTTYYYSLLGVTASGLTSIPRSPLAISTHEP